jgi:hypothetical protein
VANVPLCLAAIKGGPATLCSETLLPGYSEPRERRERRQIDATLQAAQMREAAGVPEPAPRILPTTLENAHGGNMSLRTFATECSKLPAANPTL